MRKFLVLGALIGAACGGGSSSSNNPTPLAGTFGGHAFTPTDVKAIVAGSGTTACTGIPVITAAGVKAIALEITSYPNACGDFATGSCALHQNARTVTIVVAKLNPASPTDTNPAEPTIATGDYTISSSMSGVAPDPTHLGWLVVGFAQSLGTDATCAGTPAMAQSGTLTLSQVSASAVSGHLSVTFSGGDTIAGDFSAVPVCTQTPDVCGLAQAGALCDPTGATCSP